MFRSLLAFAAGQAGPYIDCSNDLHPAYNAKKLVHDVSIGTMASVFPDDSDNAGHPFAIMEVSCPSLRSAS